MNVGHGWNICRRKLVKVFLKWKAGRLYNAMAADKDKIGSIAKAIIDKLKYENNHIYKKK